ncbi:MAG: transcriptional regulator [Deltaproteobacteria bacterium]|jgi:y4mF family transcriptional regulator|nr:MAG: transcriptional regulator [Deltaproteobacteria bacterium]
MFNPSNQDTPYGKIATVADIGRLIRRKRKEIGARQENAAALSGVGTTFLSHLENGKETVELGKTLQVLKSLGLEIYIYPRSLNPLKDR